MNMNKELKKSLTTVAGDILKIAYDANEDRIKKNLSDSQFRKVRKLANNPELFVKDTIAKKKKQARKYLPIKHDGNFNYTVVSAVYNVEKYLDEYFESLVNQSINFKKHIHLILVDDGSTDGSASIIKKWQKKFPKNIHYYYKENGGQGSARKLGLQYVETDWVTFIDADDFVNIDYFYNVDKIVSNDDAISMVCCNQIYYFEDKNQYIDRHPLNYRFKDGVKSVKFKDIGKNIHFSAALSFLKVAKIPHDLTFDEHLKPTFEDGKFINSFILEQNAEDKICYNPNSKYFNRKREDKSSTMDGIWEHKGQFTTVFERGYLDILPKCKQEKGYIPVFLQRTILWEMLKLVKQLLNRSEVINFLSEEERSNFLMNMDEVFTYIDKDVIMSYELGNCGFSRQLGMLGCFKKLDVDRQVAYLDKIDFDKNLFELRFFSSIDSDFMLLVDNEEVFPAYYKKTNRYFLDRVFLTEHRLWYSLDLLKNKKIADFSVNQRRAYVNFNKQKDKKGIVIADILNHPKTTTNNNIWLLMDRDDRAGDNAEFLYDYIQENQQHIQPYFVLGRNSIDWDRLKDKNYNLIEHGSLEHKKLLEKCSIVASSQIGYLVEPFDDINKKYKVVFLQHGITKDDVSNWLNNLNIDLLVTASMSEYLSIVDDYSKYIYGKKDVVLSGFPRFDSLYKNINNYDKKISLIFTWRKYIAGNFVENGKSERQINPDFKNTTYYQKLNELLNSNDLKQLVDKYGYQVEICPHPNMVPYIQFFDIPPHIMVVDSEKRMHDLINESQILITDFSSVAFDFAYQNKNVLYYQFDQKEFFSGEHTYQKGYFDYEQHGFGAVVETQTDLLTALEQVLQNNGEPVEPYATRIRETFPFIDNNNCERVYQAIQNLYEPSNNPVNIVILSEMLNNAYKHQAWGLVVSRATALLKYEPDNIHAQSLLVQGLMNTEQWQQANDVLEQYQLGDDIAVARELAFLMAIGRGDWQSAVDVYPQLEPGFALAYKQVQALERLNDTDGAIKLISELQQQELSDAKHTALLLRLLNVKGQYEQIIEQSEPVAMMSDDELAELKPQLLLSRAYRMLSEYDLAYAQLVAFEQHTKDDLHCRLEIAKLAFVQENYAKCIDQFDKLVEAGYVLSAGEYNRYLQAVYLTQNYAKYVQLFERFDVAQCSDEAKIAYIKCLVQQQNWQDALARAEQLSLADSPELAYELMLANYRLGDVEMVYHADTRPSREDSYDYWSLIAEIALLMGDVEQEKYCYRGMIAIYPERDKKENIAKLQALR